MLCHAGNQKGLVKAGGRNSGVGGVGCVGGVTGIEPSLFRSRAPEFKLTLLRQILTENRFHSLSMRRVHSPPHWAIQTDPFVCLRDRAKRAWEEKQKNFSRCLPRPHVPPSGPGKVGWGARTIPPKCVSFVFSDTAV